MERFLTITMEISKGIVVNLPSEGIYKVSNTPPSLGSMDDAIHSTVVKTKPNEARKRKAAFTGGSSMRI